GIALLRHRGHLVADTLVRTPTHIKKAVKRVRNEKPTLLIIHCEEATAGMLALDLLNALSQVATGITIVAVGAYPSINPGKFLGHRSLDTLIPGRWQDVLTTLADRMSRQGTLSGVNGVLRKEGGKVLATDPWKPTSPPGEWPGIAGEGLRGGELAEILGGVLPLRASHGFPFRGLFHADVYLRHITSQSSYYHMRPVSLLVEEAVRLRDELKLVAFDFIDEIFPWDDKWLANFADHWGREIHRPFAIRSCAEHLKSQRLAVLADAGLQRVTISLEAGCERLRERHSNLNNSNALVGEFITACQDVGVEVSLEVLLCTPGETTKSLDETRHLVRTLAPHEIRPTLFQGFGGDGEWKTHVAALSDKPLESPPQPETKLEEKAREIIKHLVEEGAALRGRYLAHASGGDQGKVHKVLAHLGDSDFKTPWDGVPSHEIRWFHAPDGSQPVLAIRVPGQLTQMIDFPQGAMIKFSIIQQPRLSGERSQQAVSFVVKVEQGGKNFRLFHKVLVQALDPDSRRWHSFTLPVTGIKPGLARLKLEAYLTEGGSKGDLPPDGETILAGWAGLEVLRRNDIAPTTPMGIRGQDPRSSGAVLRQRVDVSDGVPSGVIPIRLVPATNDRILFPETLSAETEQPFGMEDTPRPGETPEEKQRRYRYLHDPELEKP
ncbi:MAG: hypothetical protein JJU11_02560, partial [Candidatus Sumerlaeia bacterium]|nr:hypothetical protein [Candidatus Sumerlaeia bacterium]